MNKLVNIILIILILCILTSIFFTKKENFVKKNRKNCGSKDNEKWTGTCINGKKHGERYIYSI